MQMPPSAGSPSSLFGTLLQGVVGLGPPDGTVPLRICLIRGKKGRLRLELPLICRTSFFILIVKVSSPCSNLQASYECMLIRKTTTMATKSMFTNFILLGK
ncbi:hypothetical protein PRUPE_8G228300 [Prunus persica]|uniref:Uncharacterized protein n=1 Tax=Prunus persica TaxID=3760 RepID=A0A251N1Z6_PRUPE|nr:hypothetical protein PRUPE_8G228300 [Prunus persica]